MNKDNEKLLLPHLSMRLKRILRNKKRRSDEQASTRKSMAMVEKRLARWVSEGRYRERYCSMDMILEDLGLTRNELCSYCSRIFHKSFLSWRKELRMADARKMLLDHPEVPVYEIASELGIDDRSNFRHQFKSVTGLTPSGWRQKFLKKT